MLRRQVIFFECSAQQQAVIRATLRTLDRIATFAADGASIESGPEVDQRELEEHQASFRFHFNTNDANDGVTRLTAEYNYRQIAANAADVLDIGRTIRCDSTIFRNLSLPVGQYAIEYLHSSCPLLKTEQYGNPLEYLAWYDSEMVPESIDREIFPPSSAPETHTHISTMQKFGVLKVILKVCLEVFLGFRENLDPQ
ncbi:MAG: hypothetical protein Q9160_001129 [Pyrenula sp. 1 TL-2023]